TVEGQLGTEHVVDSQHLLTKVEDVPEGAAQQMRVGHVIGERYASKDVLQIRRRGRAEGAGRNLRAGRLAGRARPLDTHRVGKGTQTLGGGRHSGRWVAVGYDSTELLREEEKGLIPLLVVHARDIQRPA